ncbi:putative mitochondrial uncoupling protein 5 [Sesbania bispinosa]|nr:putative mitochondrial uncoupling protein 5 [Sesbania bispinosa]
MGRAKGGRRRWRGGHGGSCCGHRGKAKAVLGGGGDGEPISQRWAARLCCGYAPRPEGKRKRTAAHTVTATERGLGGVSRWLGDEAMVRDRRRRVQQGRHAATTAEELDKAVVGRRGCSRGDGLVTHDGDTVPRREAAAASISSSSSLFLVLIHSLSLVFSLSWARWWLNGGRGGHGSNCRDDGGQERPLNGGGTAAEGQPPLSLALFFFLSLLLLVGSLIFFLGANLMVRVAKGRGV